MATLSLSKQECGRRIGSIVLVAALALVGGARSLAAEATLSIRCGPYIVDLNTNGAVAGIAQNGGDRTPVAGLTDGAGSLVYGTKAAALENPVARTSSPHGCTFTYQPAAMPAITVQLHVAVRQGREGSLVLSREIDIQSSRKLAADLSVKLPLWPALGSDAWLPLFDGTGGTLGDRSACAYRFAGALPTDGVRLAIPMVSNGGGKLAPRVTIATDPYFSTLFTRQSVEWTYPKHIGLEDNPEKRTTVTVFHAGTAEDAVRTFFAEAMPDVPAGPRWLHEIALVDYDYMSDGGKGWFADIDALTRAAPREGRGKMFLCLHGWYDWLGRYCFDEKKGKFDGQWTVFGNYDKCKDGLGKMNIGGEEVDGGFAKCVPVRLSLAEMHRRLGYAASRGFRVGMYFADGLTAGMALPNFSPKRVLEMGGWPGPDTPGAAYCQNPLLSEVRQFYLAYTDRLLAEFGGEVDALVWDETNMVSAGCLGSAEVPGYADRAMMRLVREVAQKCEEYNRRNHRQVALLASDNIGTFGHAAPYALGGARHVSGLLVCAASVVVRHLPQLPQHRMVVLLVAGSQMEVDRVRRPPVSSPGRHFQWLGR